MVKKYLAKTRIQDVRHILLEAMNDHNLTSLPSLKDIGGETLLFGKGLDKAVKVLRKFGEDVFKI